MFRTDDNNNSKHIDYVFIFSKYVETYIVHKSITQFNYVFYKCCQHILVFDWIVLQRSLRWSRPRKTGDPKKDDSKQDEDDDKKRAWENEGGENSTKKLLPHLSARRSTRHPAASVARPPLPPPPPPGSFVKSASSARAFTFPAIRRAPAECLAAWRMARSSGPQATSALCRRARHWLPPSPTWSCRRSGAPSRCPCRRAPPFRTRRRLQPSRIASRGSSASLTWTRPSKPRPTRSRPCRT